jgi:hypothetical protein
MHREAWALSQPLKVASRHIKSLLPAAFFSLQSLFEMLNDRTLMKAPATSPEGGIPRPAHGFKDHFFLDPGY